MNIGIVYASLAYISWGLFPLYFAQVALVPALEVVLHRTVWAMVFVMLVLVVLRRWAWLQPLLKSPGLMLPSLVSALLLSGNWLVYVWAVHNQRVVDASLGYFMLPLVNVGLGYVFLRERPRLWQWAAFAMAACGVLWLTLQAGQVPWIALVLAATFGFYGLMRKTAALGALEGLALETLLLAPLAIGLLAFGTWQGSGIFKDVYSLTTAAPGAWQTLGWLVFAGPLTAVPLLLFAAGARRVTLATMGALQYLSPMLQLALGVWVFNEPFEPSRLLGFVFIWAALIALTLEGVWFSRSKALSICR